MEQYKQTASEEAPANTVKISDEARQLRSMDSTIKQLQDTASAQHQEILKLRRDISRLKNDISEVITTLRGRG